MFDQRNVSFLGADTNADNLAGAIPTTSTAAAATTTTKAGHILHKSSNTTKSYARCES